MHTLLILLSSVRRPKGVDEDTTCVAMIYMVLDTEWVDTLPRVLHVPSTDDESGRGMARQYKATRDKTGAETKTRAV